MLIDEIIKEKTENYISSIDFDSENVNHSDMIYNSKVDFKAGIMAVLSSPEEFGLNRYAEEG